MEIFLLLLLLLLLRLLLLLVPVLALIFLLLGVLCCEKKSLGLIRHILILVSFRAALCFFKFKRKIILGT